MIKRTRQNTEGVLAERRVRSARTRKRRGHSFPFSGKPSPPRRDQTPSAEDRLWRRNHELTVLSAVASAAYRHLELKTVLNVALKETLALTRVGGGIIYLYEKGSRCLAPIAHRGVSAALLRKLHGMRLGESFSGAVAASRKPLVIPDARGDARTVGSAFARRGLCAYVGVPIFCRRKVLGVFALLDRRPDRFTKEDVALLGRIAKQLGVAIENARLYGEVHRELAARKEAEAALRESEERFRVIFERAPLGIALVTFQGRMLQTNPAFQEMLGYTADELRGKSIPAITHPRDMKSERRLFRAAVAGKQPRMHVEKRYVHKDGRIVWGDLNCCLHRDAAGRPRFIIGIIENITERKRMEEALRQERDRAEQYLDIAGVMLLVVAADQRLAMINRKGQQILGYSAEEIIGRNWVDVLLPARDRERVRAEFFQLMAGEIKPGSFEHAIVTRAGQERTIAWHNTILRDERGKITGCLASGEDITDLREKEKALSSLLTFQNEMLDSAAIWISMLDARANVTFWNRAAETISGYLREEVVGHAEVWKWIAPELAKRGELRRQLKVCARRHERLENLETTIRCKDGQRKVISWHSNNLADESGRFVGGVILGADVTDRKRAEERLKTYRERLRSLASQLALAEERERRRIATALHDEVGQALALARLKLGELAGASPRQEFTALVQTVYEMVAQILQRTRSLTFELSPPVLYELSFEDALGWLVEQFQKQHPICWEFLADHLPDRLPDDVRVTLFHAVRELLFNVVKHAHAGIVTVVVECDPGEVRIRVEDDGVGFAADELWSNPRAMDGFGLFSVRERLESLGGRLEIDSRGGGGTRATLAAPLTSSDVPPKGA
jgi:PAS domain S-box-containing protein